MNWQDEGFLLSKIKFRENANIVNVFTISKGKISGIVYGGTSKKIRNFLQISNKIFVIYSSKSENRLGYLKTELVEAISPKYLFGSRKGTKDGRVMGMGEGQCRLTTTTTSKQTN